MSYHQIRNHRMHEEFRFGRNHHRPYHHQNFYQNSVFGGGYPPYGAPYGNPFGGYPEPPKPSFIDRIFPFAAAGFLGYQVGKAPGNNFGEKVGGFLSGVGNFVGGILGKEGVVGKLLGGIFG